MDVFVWHCLCPVNVQSSNWKLEKRLETKQLYFHQIWTSSGGSWWFSSGQRSRTNQDRTDLFTLSSFSLSYNLVSCLHLHSLSESPQTQIFHILDHNIYNFVRIWMNLWYCIENFDIRGPTPGENDLLDGGPLWLWEVKTKGKKPSRCFQITACCRGQAGFVSSAGVCWRLRAAGWHTRTRAELLRRPESWKAERMRSYVCSLRNNPVCGGIYEPLTLWNEVDSNANICSHRVPRPVTWNPKTMETEITVRSLLAGSQLFLYVSSKWTS